MGLSLFSRDIPGVAEDRSGAGSICCLKNGLLPVQADPIAEIVQQFNTYICATLNITVTSSHEDTYTTSSMYLITDSSTKNQAT